MISLEDCIELVGISGVVASVLFLAYEIRQNTDVAAAQAVYALNEGAREGLVAQRCPKFHDRS